TRTRTISVLAGVPQRRERGPPRRHSMLIKRGGGLQERDTTPYDVYLNRRAFMVGIGALALAPRAGAAADAPPGQALKSTPNPTYKSSDSTTPLKDITSYNN